MKHLLEAEKYLNRPNFWGDVFSCKEMEKKKRIKNSNGSERIIFILQIYFFGLVL